jgi:hypothetical protein
MIVKKSLILYSNPHQLRAIIHVHARKFLYRRPFPFSVSACYSFCAIVILILIQGAFPWNGPHRNTKRSTSTAKSAHTPTLSCSAMTASRSARILIECA